MPVWRLTRTVQVTTFRREEVAIEADTPEAAHAAARDHTSPVLWRCGGEFVGQDIAIRSVLLLGPAENPSERGLA